MGAYRNTNAPLITVPAAALYSPWLVLPTPAFVPGLGYKVTKTENGVNPLCFGQTALLGCDVWEHSYYIDFRNKRPAYLSNFLEKLVNWEAVAAKL